MFDLDANPAAIAAGLGSDPVLAPLLRACPGIRAPGCSSLFEATVRAIVGQQVSTAAARSICARLALACSPDPQQPLFPRAGALAALEDDHFPMPGRRRAALQALCRQYQAREELLDLDALADAQGVGPWTLDMVRMRGAGEPDAFPRRDLGLERAWTALGGGEITLTEQARQWRPWRAYAANLLWRSLTP
jgi:AraC family transcriptional regulator of adaptative response / DNA-3-methyladenine glycosylase II